MKNLKNLKIVKELQKVSPKLKWLMFDQMQDYKINSKYIDMLCSNSSRDVSTNHSRIEAMVRESLVKEFSSDIEKMKSYELLVDEIVHNLKKKQLSSMENEKIE